MVGAIDAFGILDQATIDRCRASVQSVNLSRARLLARGIDSERFGTAVKNALLDVGGIELIRDPDLDSDEENVARDELSLLPEGGETPSSSRSSRRTCSGITAYCHPRISNVCATSTTRIGTVCPAVPGDQPTCSRPCKRGGCRRRPTELGTTWCFEFAAQLASAESVDGLIVMATPDLSDLVLLEGHARLTAIFVGGLQQQLTVRSYLGLSSDLSQWSGF